MIERIVRCSLGHRPFILARGVLLGSIGAYSVTQLNVDAVPDITNIQVQVVTAAPALGPLEIEQYITYAVESALSGLPGVDELRSVSRYGIPSGMFSRASLKRSCTS